ARCRGTPVLMGMCLPMVSGIHGRPRESVPPCGTASYAAHGRVARRSRVAVAYTRVANLRRFRHGTADRTSLVADPGRRNRFGDRKVEHKGKARASCRGRLVLQSTTECSHEPLRDRESKTRRRKGRGAAVPAALEWLEQPPLGVRGNTWPRVVDRQLHPIMLMVRRTHRHTAREDALQCIVTVLEQNALTFG